MTTAIAIAVLVLFDALLGGVRAAAGRDGGIAKPRTTALRSRGRPSPDDGHRRQRGAGSGARRRGVRSGRGLGRPCAGGRPLCRGVRGFASVVLIALLFWFAPVRELRMIPTLTVLGPLTLLRPFVVAGGLLFAAAGASTWRVWLVAAVAGTSMLAFEHVLGRRYADRWRRLV